MSVKKKSLKRPGAATNLLFYGNLYFSFVLCYTAAVLRKKEHSFPLCFIFCNLLRKQSSFFSFSFVLSFCNLPKTPTSPPQKTPRGKTQRTLLLKKFLIIFLSMGKECFFFLMHLFVRESTRMCVVHTCVYTHRGPSGGLQDKHVLLRTVKFRYFTYNDA